MNIEEAIKQSFMLFSGNYGKLWDPTNNTVAAWLLIVGDDNPMDVLKASLEWCRSDSKYPPTAGQIHRKIPADVARCRLDHPLRIQFVGRRFCAILESRTRRRQCRLACGH